MLIVVGLVFGKKLMIKVLNGRSCWWFKRLLVYGEMIDVVKVILGCWNVEFGWISALEKVW